MLPQHISIPLRSLDRLITLVVRPGQIEGQLCLEYLCVLAIIRSELLEPLLKCPLSGIDISLKQKQGTKIAGRSDRTIVDSLGILHYTRVGRDGDCGLVRPYSFFEAFCLP